MQEIYMLSNGQDSALDHAGKAYKTTPHVSAGGEGHTAFFLKFYFLHLFPTSMGW